MFKIINDGVEKPKLYPKIERSIPTVKKRGWVKVDGKKLRDHKDFIPQTGFQEALCTCDADVIFSGGEASSGKTICILMEAMRGLGKARIFGHNPEKGACRNKGRRWYFNRR